MGKNWFSTEDQFIKCVQLNSLDRTKEYACNTAIKINELNSNWECRTIRNVEFIEAFEVCNVDLKYGLHFENCKFNKGIKFKSVISKMKHSLERDEKGGGISFTNCSFEFIQFENECIIFNKIRFDECSIKKIEFNDIIVEAEAVWIKNCNISEIIDVSNSKFNLDISTSDINKLRVESLNGEVSLTKNEIHDWVQFNRLNSKDLVLNWNVYKGSFSVKESQVSGFYIHGDQFFKEGIYENRSFNNQNKVCLHLLHITDAKFKGGFKFDGLSGQLQKFSIEFNSNMEGILELLNWKILETNFAGINSNFSLLLNHVEFKRLILNSFRNFGVIHFNNSNATHEVFESEEKPEGSKSCIIIANSNLGESRFYEFDFNSFDYLNISNSSLEEIKTSNVSWFDDRKLQVDGLKDKRELYRQIKQSLHISGNNIESLQFKAREIKTYKKELENLKKINFGDKIIMWVSWTNDFGLNWIKPLIMIIFGTISFYCLILPLISPNISYVTGGTLVCPNKFLKEFSSFSNVLANMFNPVRRTKDVYGESIPNIVYFLDLLHRVFLSVFIFQLVIAFRKYSNKY
jgi:hypothetical protein